MIPDPRDPVGADSYPYTSLKYSYTSLKYSDVARGTVLVFEKWYLSILIV